MLLTMLVTMLCAGGITFYVRFLVAMLRECAPLRMGSWARLRMGSAGHKIAELPLINPATPLETHY